MSTQTRLLPERLVSLDAYRGLTMLAMASGGLGLHRVAQNFSDSSFWKAVGYQFEHVEWVGCSLWDLIQPSFTFMVGVAMAYSCASRQAHGQSYGRMLGHAVVRSLVLVLLGIFLRSDGRSQTNFTFEDVLTQIGLGYVFLFLLWGRSPWLQLSAAIAILAGYWCLFYFWPLPAADFDYASVGVPSNWPHLQGIAQHWDKNTNAAAAFDQWFLNLFPRPNGKPFVYNGGGYLTLSFIPSLATMIFGLLAGELLRSTLSSGQKFASLVIAGLLGLSTGWILDATGVCPIVKRIWTPSWTLFSTGWTFLILAGFYSVVDILRYRRWAFPLVVVGMNSITMYCMEELSHGWFHRTLKSHLGGDIFQFLGKPYEPFLARLWVLVAMWLVCYWLYRQKIFIRI
jgi:heparan-alpha-glucosaminide N-acetyltransferase